VISVDSVSVHECLVEIPGLKYLLSVLEPPGLGLSLLLHGFGHHQTEMNPP
jgi:hypothetical protein